MTIFFRKITPHRALFLIGLIFVAFSHPRLGLPYQYSQSKDDDHDNNTITRPVQILVVEPRRTRLPKDKPRLTWPHPHCTKNNTTNDNHDEKNNDNDWIPYDGLSYAKHVEFYGTDPYSDVIAMPVLCFGPDYDEFGRTWHHYALNQSIHGPTWGRGHHARIPPNQTILLYGNSHVRQMAWSWIIQHMDDPFVATSVNHIVNVTKLVPNQSAVRVTFDNNSTLYVVTNSHVPFGPHWQTYLQDLLDDRPLNTSGFDAVIVSFINGCTNESIADFIHRYPELSCDQVQPSPEEWIDAYPNGPLLFMRPFYARREAQAQQWARTVLRARPFRNASLGFIDHRHHIVAMGHEGSNTNPSGDVDCPTCGIDGHRCVGEWGGHPDMAGWDIAQWLHIGIDSTNHPYYPRPFLTKLDRNGEWRPYIVIEREAQNATPSLREQLTTDHLEALTSNTSWMEMDELPVCRSQQIVPAAVAAPQQRPWKISHQCEGGNYTEMAALIHSYVLNLKQQSSGANNWGEQRLAPPIPPNQTVLVVGDSHARQVVYALLCQSQSNIRSLRTLDGQVGGSEVIFANHGRLVFLLDSVFFYSPNWTTLVPQHIGISSLNALDAIVVGSSSECDHKDSVQKPSYFTQKMIQLQQTISNKKHMIGMDDSAVIIDCLQYNPPDMTAWLFAYDGPLIFFNRWPTVGDIEYRARLQVAHWSAQLKQRQGRQANNLKILSGRRYIQAVGHEGAALSAGQVLDAGTPTAFPGAHRCNGIYGGYPDLTAWDILQALDELLGEVSDSTQ